MEQTQRTTISDVHPITSKTIVFILLIFLSVLLGVLNFVVPAHYLAVVIVLSVAGIILFLYPFVGLLVYLFITIIQPGVIFPSLHVLHPERLMAIFLIISLIVNIKLRRDKLIVTDHKLLYLMLFFIFSMLITIPESY